MKISPGDIHVSGVGEFISMAFEFEGFSVDVAVCFAV